MKKSKVLAAAMASIALTGSISSCASNACENVEPDVYGPSTPYEEPVEEPESAEEYDPVMNTEPTVYGPPKAYEKP
jgi:hypothetical protein